MTYKQCADALKTSVEERVDIEDELYPDRVHITARLGLLGLARAYGPAVALLNSAAPIGTRTRALQARS